MKNFLKRISLIIIVPIVFALIGLLFIIYSLWRLFFWIFTGKDIGNLPSPDFIKDII